LNLHNLETRLDSLEPQRMCWGEWIITGMAVAEAVAVTVAAIWLWM